MTLGGGSLWKIADTRAVPIHRSGSVDSWIGMLSSGSVVELDRQNWRNEYRSTTIVWVTYSRHLGTQVGAIFYYSDS